MFDGLYPSIDYIPGTYEAYTHRNFTREAVETLFDSAELNGTLYDAVGESLNDIFDHLHQSMQGKDWGKSIFGALHMLPMSYSGLWNYTQLCYLYTRPEVDQLLPKKPNTGPGRQPAGFMIQNRNKPQPQFVNGEIIYPSLNS